MTKTAKVTVKLVKVTLQYSDGSLRILEDRCEEWEKSVNSALIMDFMHGTIMPKFDWYELKSATDSRTSNSVSKPAKLKEEK
jgi:hypothetical protein